MTEAQSTPSTSSEKVAGALLGGDTGPPAAGAHWTLPAASGEDEDVRLPATPASSSAAAASLLGAVPNEEAQLPAALPSTLLGEEVAPAAAEARRLQSSPSLGPQLTSGLQELNVMWEGGASGFTCTWHVATGGAPRTAPGWLPALTLALAAAALGLDGPSLYARR
eukprot:NODE_20335_length_803_cov_1.581361.p1 GENE.NODE_20335_length_803_cov_1.581361~~NODE_20335_length_803_cov_1.581361.p1  ORF type:complete len:194 (+),score=50.17 NODE_20335_length_803_cov_1.581361:87-584(+)